MSFSQWSVTNPMSELLSCGYKKRWDRKCFNSPVMSMWLNRLYKTSSDGNVGFVWVGLCPYPKNVRKYLFLTVLGRQNCMEICLIMTILPGSTTPWTWGSSQSQISSFIKVCSLLGDIVHKNRKSSWNEAAEISGQSENKDWLFTFALWNL